MTMTRRQFLQRVLWLGSLSLTPLLSAQTQSGSPPLSLGTFIQPWLKHNSFSQSQWHDYFHQLSQLGFKHVVLQWTGRKTLDNSQWRLSDQTLEHIFHYAQAYNMWVTMGFIYDEKWDVMINESALQATQSFFAQSLIDIETQLQNNPFQKHSQFAGYYIPYEIEQYSWAAIEKRQSLIQWLTQTRAMVTRISPHIPSISTYASQLHSELSLVDLWADISSYVSLDLMIQDGVGIQGLRNYSNLLPLISYLKEHKLPFDMVLELFEETSDTGNKNEPFHAISANTAHLHTQIELMQKVRPSRVMVFSADPWLLANNPRAQALKNAWLKRKIDISK